MTSPIGPQQVSQMAGPAPWLPPQQSPGVAPPFQLRTPQIGGGQSAVLREQEALAQQLRGRSPTMQEPPPPPVLPQVGIPPASDTPQIGGGQQERLAEQLELRDTQRAQGQVDAQAQLAERQRQAQLAAAAQQKAQEDAAAQQAAQLAAWDAEGAQGPGGRAPRDD